MSDDINTPDQNIPSIDVRSGSERPRSHLHQAVFPVLALLTDTFWISAAYWFGYWLRFTVEVIPITKNMPTFESYVLGYFGALGIWIILLARGGLYQMAQMRCLSDQLSTIVKAGFLGFLFFLAAAFFYRDESYSRLMIALSWLLILVAVSINRTIILRPLSRWLARRGMGGSRVAVVGNGPQTEAIVDNLIWRPPPGIELIGTIGAHIPQGTRVKPVRYLGKISDMASIILSERLDRLIITIPFSDHTNILTVLKECARFKLRYDFVPDLFGMLTSGLQVTDLGGVPLLVFRSRPIDGWGAVAKRVTDIVVSTVGLLILWPLLLIITLVIWKESGRPILYRQQRVGLDNKVFTMNKFRSMQPEAESASGPVWAKKDDPRRTPVGAFLRRSNLDELPQLWNVLKGEMSLVGPRPERPFFVEKFQEQVPRYLERHRVRAGMTGWAQVNGLRGNTSIEERTRYDNYYVENWSLWFDLKILVRTLSASLKGENAY